MTTSSVQSLLGAVRRRLWTGQFHAAARLAFWGVAGVMLLAAAVHLAARPVPASAVLWATVVLLASLLAWAGWRRPTDSACALWADRHLGGTSAYTTLLEMRQGTSATPNAQAVRQLEHWATARATDSLRLLAERQDSAHLSRSLLSMLACTALGTLVLTLPDLAPSSRQRLAAVTPTASANRPTPAPEPPITTELASEIASALRSAASDHAADQREAGRAPAAGHGKSDDGNSSLMAQPGATLLDARASVRESLSAPPAAAASVAGAAQASGAGSGRDAGDSRDDHAGVDDSRIPQSTLAVHRRESAAGRLPQERLADMDQPATFDDDLSPQRAAPERADAAPAAATPPPAIEATRLTPTEAIYVQAWMKSSGQRR